MWISCRLYAYVVTCTQIEEVRQQTKAEKKRMAMAMREKQLVQLGMMV